VRPWFPARTVPEFIAYAKANPGKLKFGKASIGTMAHMASELVKVMAGVDMTRVPYRGLAPEVKCRRLAQGPNRFEISSSRGPVWRHNSSHPAAFQKSAS
jgi:hypothetical protein